MSIYIISFLLMIAYGTVLLPRNKGRVFLIMLFFQTFLIYALRAPCVGTDTANMMEKYKNASFSIKSIFSSKAPFYYLLMCFFRIIIPGSQGYAVLCGLIIIGGIGIYIYKYSTNYFLSAYLFFVLYFFFHSMNTAREFCAISIAANGVGLLQREKNRYRLGSILIVLSIFIHLTAIVMLPLVLLPVFRKLKWRRRFYFIYILFSMLYEQIITAFIKVFPAYAFYLRSGVFFEVGQNRKILLSIFYLLLLILFLCYYIKNYKYMTEKMCEECEMDIFFMAMTATIGFLALKSILITRIEYYFSIQMIVVIPKIIKIFTANSRIIAEVLIMLLCGVPGIYLLIINSSEVVPYIFFWSY